MKKLMLILVGSVLAANFHATAMAKDDSSPTIVGFKLETHYPKYADPYTNGQAIALRPSLLWKRLGPLKKLTAEEAKCVKQQNLQIKKALSDPATARRYKKLGKVKAYIGLRKGNPSLENEYGYFSTLAGPWDLAISQTHYDGVNTNASPYDPQMMFNVAVGNNGVCFTESATKIIKSIEEYYTANVVPHERLNAAVTDFRNALKAKPPAQPVISDELRNAFKRVEAQSKIASQNEPVHSQAGVDVSGP